MDLLATISSYFPSLSKSEKKVAQLILSNPDEVEHLSINELAMNAGVGESTIVRFSRKIGLAGFQDLKYALVKYQSSQENQAASESNEFKDVIYRQFAESLEDTRTFIQQQEVDQVAALIDQAERIYLFAVGTSGLVAQQLSNRLKRLGKSVEFVPDGHLQSIYSALIREQDLVFAISTSGNTREVIQDVELAKQIGAKVVTLTNFIGSRITQVGDVSLVVSSKEFLSDAGSFTATVSQLYILDTILKSVVEINPKKYHELRNLTNRALLKNIE